MPQNLAIVLARIVSLDELFRVVGFSITTDFHTFANLRPLLSEFRLWNFSGWVSNLPK